MPTKRAFSIREKAPHYTKAQRAELHQKELNKQDLWLKIVTFWLDKAYPWSGMWMWMWHVHKFRKKQTLFLGPPPEGGLDLVTNMQGAI